VSIRSKKNYLQVDVHLVITLTVATLELVKPREGIAEVQPVEHIGHVEHVGKTLVRW